MVVFKSMKNTIIFHNFISFISVFLGYMLQGKVMFSENSIFGALVHITVELQRNLSEKIHIGYFVHRNQFAKQIWWSMDAYIQSYL